MQLGGSFPGGKSLSWQKIDPSEGHPPEPRNSCSMCYHYDSKQAFLYGGKNNEGNEFDDRLYSLTIHQTEEGSVKAKWKVLEDCRGNSPGNPIPTYLWDLMKLYRKPQGAQLVFLVCTSFG